MWLLKTDTMELEQFYRNTPRYAILSHRWEDKEEVTFDNIKNSPEHLRGYQKVKDFCKRASSKGYKYAWVDTCCIDKRSSAELNEAINSMYQWYAKAAVCYVYMSDVDSRADIRRSSWFTRGWTLQELLAPSKLYFFNRHWALIGSKMKMADKLQKITSIPRTALLDFKLPEFRVAEKMSWAAHRQTTREEDQAYCLLGLFDINIPLYYGEGKKAFYRLQEEIMKASTDVSLFLWHGQPCETFGMLAVSPLCFTNVPECLTLTVFGDSPELSNGWHVNNAGMRIRARLSPYMIAEGSVEIFLMNLHEPSLIDHFVQLGIFVEQMNCEGEPIYRRVAVNGMTWVQITKSTPSFPWVSVATSQISILRKPLYYHQAPDEYGLHFEFDSRPLCQCTLRQRPVDQADKELQNWPVAQKSSDGKLNCSFKLPPNHLYGVVGYLLIELGYDLELLLCFGFDQSFRPFCVIVPFCKWIYELGLCPSHIMQTLHCLSPQETPEGQALHSTSCIVAVCGVDRGLSYLGDGEFVQVWMQEGRVSKEHRVSIDFKPRVFFKEYFDDEEELNFRSTGTISEKAVESLQTISPYLYNAQRKLFGLWGPCSSLEWIATETGGQMVQDGEVLADIILEEGSSTIFRPADNSLPEMLKSIHAANMYSSFLRHRSKRSESHQSIIDLLTHGWLSL